MKSSCLCSHSTDSSVKEVRGFQSPLHQGDDLIVPVLQVMMRKLIMLDLETPQMRMTQASGDTNPLLHPLHIVNPLTMLSLPPQKTTMVVGLENPPLNVRHLQRIDRHWNGHNKSTTASYNMEIGIANKNHVGYSRLHTNLNK